MVTIENWPTYAGLPWGIAYFYQPVICRADHLQRLDRAASLSWRGSLLPGARSGPSILRSLRNRAGASSLATVCSLVMTIGRMEWLDPVYSRKAM
jgi:hypothetical protein